MNKDSAATNAKNLAKAFEQELKAFFEKPLIEKLEVMRKRIASDNPQLTSIIDELKERTDEWETSGHIEFHDSSIYAGIKYYCEDNFQDLLCFIALQAFIAAPTSHLTATYQNELRKKNNLTSSKLRDAIIHTLKKNYPGEIEHGGDRRKFWNPYKEIYLLSIYNRFQIVIKNARKDFEKSKSKMRESKARREVFSKYQIPEKYFEDYSDRLFTSDLKPKLICISMEWAKDIVGCDEENNLGIVLSRARERFKEISELKNYNPKKLVGVHNLVLGGAISTVTLTGKGKAGLCFTDLRLNDFTMLYFI